MAALEVAKPPAAAISPPAIPPSKPNKTAAAPSGNKRKKQKDDDSIKGIKRNRLRIDGKKVTPEEIKKWILDLIRTKARTPSELADETGYTRQQVFNYCKKLMEEGQIEKEGQAYKLKGLSSQAVQAQKFEELSEEEFYKLPVMQKFLDACKRQPSRNEQRTKFESICFGRVVPGWKINPQNWREPETTDTFVQAYRTHFGVKELPKGVRDALRGFILYALELPLEKSKAADRGISGKKENTGAHKYLKLSDEEINKALDLLEGDEETQALFALWSEGFPRPERGLLIECSSFEFAKKDLTFAYVKGENKVVTDQSTVQILKMQQQSTKAVIDTLASMLRGAGINVPDNAGAALDMVEFKTIAKDFATFKVHETKTHGGKVYQKYMIDDRKIAIVKRWVEKRKAQGYRYVFYNGSEDVDESQGGDILSYYAEKTYAMRGHPGAKGLYEKLRAVFKALGKTDPYFYDRPAYAMRHVGAHVWLRRTNYNYGIVAAMGWDSIDTLMGYYGGMDEQTTFSLAMDTLAKSASGTLGLAQAALSAA